MMERKTLIVRASPCHPAREYYANGLCYPCYYKARNNNQRVAVDGRLKVNNEGIGPNRKYTDEERKERRRKQQKEFSKRLKAEAFAHYGTFCVNCGESRPDLLTLDHINDDGAAHRRELNVKGGGPFYAAMKKLGWPAGLQTLCFNCNCSKEWSKMPRRPRLLHLTRRLT